MSVRVLLWKVRENLSECDYKAHCGQMFETESVFSLRDLTYFFFFLTSFKHVSELFL